MVTVINGANETWTDIFWMHQGNPVSPSSLTMNLICRVVFSTLSTVLMWVPLTLLRRNGEFAAVILIIITMIYNTFTGINALIWRNDDTSSWWLGRGYCDAYIYVNYPITTVHTACVFASMRKLAGQISLMRADSPSLHETRRRNLLDALIIFPVPLLQVAWTYPISIHRYYILSLSGCFWWPGKSWPTLVFFTIPQPVFALAAAWYAVVTFWRFRQLSRDTMSALSTANNRATLRARRTKRRLYFMTLAILALFLPVIIVLFVQNLNLNIPVRHLDMDALRSGEIDGLPWDAIILLPTRLLHFTTLNDRFAAMFTAVPVFVAFGMTKDAINVYRAHLVALGLGTIWPVLKEEYNPDSQVGSSTTHGILTSSETTQSYSKNSISVTHTDRSQTPPITAPHRASRFNLFSFFTTRTSHSDDTLSRAHILVPEEFEMQPTMAELHPAALHWHADSTGAGVQTRVWSRDDEPGEGPSRPGQGL